MLRHSLLRHYLLRYARSAFLAKTVREAKRRSNLIKCIMHRYSLLRPPSSRPRKDSVEESRSRKDSVGESRPCKDSKIL